MGIWRDLIYGPAPSNVIVRGAVDPRDSEATGSPPTLEDLIAAEIQQRIATFTLADALEMPAVIRAVQLICSLIAQFQPIAYRDGVPLPTAQQPRFLRQPAPFGTRYQFMYQTIYSQLAMAGSAGTGGDAYWLVIDRDELGMARAAIVLDPAEVAIEWNRARFLPRYSWRGREFTDDPDLLHLTIGRPPGSLHGRSPLIAGLDALAIVDAAERYALGFFTTSGIPSVVIKAAGKGSPEEAARLKAQWMSAHNGPESTPAVMFQGSGALDLEYPSIDAQKAQLQEARAYGATIVARLLGIPAPLLHVETSGATITYVNSGGAIDEFVRTTAGPVYLAPLEGYLSAMVPQTQTVRIDTAELNRIDVAGRMGVYAQAITAGVMTPPEARMLEGWPTAEPIPVAPAFAPTPRLPQTSSAFLDQFGRPFVSGGV